MKGTTRIVACAECETFWHEAAAPVCADDGHLKVHHERHIHEDDVALPGGPSIVAVSYDDEYERDRAPIFGLYLDARWSPPWPHDHVDWPDFGLPRDPDLFREQLCDLLVRAQHGQRVELGCLGGHGRTGTALACAAILSGHDARTATEWVRTTYCDRAVETLEQEAFVLVFSVSP